MINCFTIAAGFTTILKLETREVAEFQYQVGAFHFGCFNNSGQDCLCQSAICHLTNILGFLVELPFLIG